MTTWLRGTCLLFGLLYVASLLSMDSSSHFTYVTDEDKAKEYTPTARLLAIITEKPSSEKFDFYDAKECFQNNVNTDYKDSNGNTLLHILSYQLNSVDSPTSLKSFTDMFELFVENIPNEVQTRSNYEKKTPYDIANAAFKNTITTSALGEEYATRLENMIIGLTENVPAEKNASLPIEGGDGFCNIS
jgi:hypothetical protein